MINWGYHAARRLGHWRRSSFARAMQKPGFAASWHSRYHDVVLPFRLLTFSGQRDLPEQVASLLSLFVNAGLPEQVLVASDGSHQDDSIALLQQLHPSLDVRPWHDLAPNPLPPVLAHHASCHPLGKKLSLLIQQSATSSPHSPLLYADSDILFFRAAAGLSSILDVGTNQSRYLLDCQPALDCRLLSSNDSTDLPLNSGLLLFQTVPTWQAGLTSLSRLWHEDPHAKPDHYSEQTVVHLAVQPPDARLLPHHRCVVSILDQFIYSDLYAQDSQLVLRHYVNNVRHKLWQSLPLALGAPR